MELFFSHSRFLHSAAISGYCEARSLNPARTLLCEQYFLSFSHYSDADFEFIIDVFPVQGRFVKHRVLLLEPRYDSGDSPAPYAVVVKMKMDSLYAWVVLQKALQCNRHNFFPLCLVDTSQRKERFFLPVFSISTMVVEPSLTVAFLSAGRTYIEEAELLTSEMV